ncbi:hypothetical protein PHYSODRAFT_415024, partial [Phytophthora sojae]
MRSTFYNYEALEIVILTRGIRCSNTTNSSSIAAACTTVFVDDYRYERDIVQTNLLDWYSIISMLRGSAQAYVWVRLILLIPFQVIVYSSLLPVAGYVLALVLDSSFMDIFLDSYWASVGGAVNFKLVPFLQTTAVQMRAVWLVAL